MWTLMLQTEKRRNGVALGGKEGKARRSNSRVPWVSSRSEATVSDVDQEGRSAAEGLCARYVGEDGRNYLEHMWAQKRRRRGEP